MFAAPRKVIKPLWTDAVVWTINNQNIYFHQLEFRLGQSAYGSPSEWE